MNKAVLVGKAMDSAIDSCTAEFNFVNEPSNDQLCPVCMEPMMQPFLTDCGHYLMSPSWNSNGGLGMYSWTLGEPVSLRTSRLLPVLKYSLLIPLRQI